MLAEYTMDIEPKRQQKRDSAKKSSEYVYGKKTVRAYENQKTCTLKPRQNKIQNK